MKHLGHRPQNTLRIRVQTLNLTQYSWKGQFGILIVAATEEGYQRQCSQQQNLCPSALQMYNRNTQLG